MVNNRRKLHMEMSRKPVLWLKGVEEFRSWGAPKSATVYLKLHTLKAMRGSFLSLVAKIEASKLRVGIRYNDV